MKWRLLLPLLVTLGCGASTANPPSGAGPSDARPLLAGDACACEGAAGDVCVLQLGGPAVQVGAAPDLSCRRGCQFLVAPTPEEVCTCLAQAPMERCWPSTTSRNLCDCDNGIR
jgi:hypothetical protein